MKVGHGVNFAQLRLEVPEAEGGNEAVIALVTRFFSAKKLSKETDKKVGGR